METLPTSQPTLLFIPDISGFTQFVNDTEILHSKHIIEELLERVIDSNSINLTVSEIEGDAILFYRQGLAPTAAELLAQVQKMFINFHAHLLRYHTHRVCQCGACSTAHGLTLKFFCHYGEVSLNKVKTHIKLFGRDVILAHRLMKNSIMGHEYALFTHDLMQACPQWVDMTDLAWAPLNSGTEEYDTGEVRYCYVSLDALNALVPPPSPEDYSTPGATDLIMEVEKEIFAPIETVFDVVSDLSFRHQWMVGLKDSDRLNHKIIQPGSTHRCVINNNEKDPFIVTHDFKISRDLITFTDTNNQGIVTVCLLRRIDHQRTHTELKFFMKPNFIKKTLFNLFMKKKFVKELNESLDNLDTYCAQLAREGRQHPNHIELGFK